MSVVSNTILVENVSFESLINLLCIVVSKNTALLNYVNNFTFFHVL